MSLERGRHRAVLPRSRSERGRKGEEGVDAEEEIAVVAEEQSRADSGAVSGRVGGGNCYRGQWDGREWGGRQPSGKN